MEKRIIRLFLVPLLAAVLPAWAQLKAPAPAQPKPPAKQEASKEENETVIEIVKCMVAGLPEDWTIAVMELNLEKPFDETGGVRYIMGRNEARVADEFFTPCNVKEPARRLIEARKWQSRTRQGWIGARVTVFRDGKYGIRYGYPPPPQKKK